ncbi:MAG TPA: hypothetical protein VJV78_27035 [Polyangiales bacterium]|nr:hypothetical protein [Polyangiales bacterium]
MRHLIALVVLASLLAVMFRVVPRALEALRSKPQDAAAELALAAPLKPRAKPLRVLFVGNSHTFMHDMPRMVQQLAAAAQDARPFEVGMVTTGGATLADHLQKADVPGPLAAGPWHYVVLQEQQQRPSWTFNRAQVDREFFAPARTFDVMIRAANSRTVLYMTPARLAGDPDNVQGDTYDAMQQRSDESYRQLGRELNAQLVPAGPAWQRLHRERPSLQLWAADGYHPSLLGAYLTACVFYGVLYGHSPLDNPYRAGLPAESAQLVQRAADLERNL